MSKITDYSAVTELNSSNVFLLDGDEGTKKISASVLLQALAEMSDDPSVHRNTYGGRYLGTSVTDEQYAQIAAGTFHGMLIGDYWTINGVNYRIADFDYWLGCGDQGTGLTTHHVLVVPDTGLANCKMNDTNIVTGAYVGSDFYTGNNGNVGYSTANSAIIAAFGSTHILSHREYLANAVSDGKETAGAWYDRTVDLMNESMVYGTERFHNQVQGTAFASYYTIDKTQLALFRMDPTRITNRTNWWLRDVVYGLSFARVAGTGNATASTASDTYGVRPCFGICAA